MTTVATVRGPVDTIDLGQTLMHEHIFNITAEIEGKTYVLPTVWDNQIVSPDEAVKRAHARGLDKWPSYKTEDEASKRYDAMHGYMEQDAWH